MSDHPASSSGARKPLVSVVVPFYNEEANVAPLHERVSTVFEGLPAYDCECLYMNDGSTDGTRAALVALAEADPRVRPVHLARNAGQSAALVAGMQRARGDYVLTIDGDLQNDPADFPRFLELLQEYDCVCGYRANRRDTFVRRASSRIANRVRTAILGDGLRDTGCGTKGFRRHCVRHLVPFNGMHRFIGVMMKAAGASITECPVAHHPRVHGASKYGIQNRLWRGLYDLIGVGWLRARYVPFEVEGED
jgi:dolichol-phosphate mannosyltransferase